ncbi:hypothetical protein HMI48_00640 [Acidithiobacillus ferrooxidans]|uniref:hypothetical protein n=1 Tax=Acidithiobacillus ferrooxidans TaxID=920 RepID=UPI001C07B8CE|nr:hypothetical protein [Acidithiobacillus ferrooxidans]MBU2772468.1 hypothetical protein [Acidithiobacillus ferrooxidans]
MESSQVDGFTQATGSDRGCHFYRAHSSVVGRHSLHTRKSTGQPSGARCSQGETLITSLPQRIVGSIATAAMLYGMVLAFDVECWPLVAFLIPVSLATAGIGFFAVDR